MYEFIDISEFQSGINFHQVWADGIHAVMIRATHGAKSVDTHLARHAHYAREAGLAIGLYHYAYPNLHAADVEARHFCEVAAHYGKGVPLMLDMEEGTAHESYVHWSRTFNHVCKARLGVWPYFYSYSAYIQSMRVDKPIGRGLILANYGLNDGHRHTVATPRPWHNLSGHQYTSKGRVKGVQGFVDRDVALADIFHIRGV